MKKLLGLSVLLLLAVSVSTREAEAVIAFGQNVTPDVIFGSGNANGSFTTDRAGSLELGLRAKVRYPVPMNVFNNNGLDNRYTFSVGHSASNPDRPLWNFEWSINTNYDGLGADVLSSLTYRLDIDFDPGIGSTNFQSFDPINLTFADHAIGTNSTGNGGGTTATDNANYATLIASNNVAQNSWSLGFFDDGTHISMPDVAGEYDIVLTAFNGATQVGQTSILVAAVPEPSAFLFGGLVCSVLGANYVRKRLKSGQPPVDC